MRIRSVRTTVAAVLIMAILAAPMTMPVAQGAAETVDSRYLGSSPGRFNSIKAADIDDDGNVEIVFGNTEGFLSIIESNGGTYSSEYHKDMHAHRLWGVALGDLDQDGKMEIILGGQAGHGGEGLIIVLDGKTRAVKWKAIAEVPGLEAGKEVTFIRDLHGLRIADPDMDGELELIVSGGYKTDNPWGMLYIFNGKTLKLEALIGPHDSRIRAIAVADIDEDGKAEIVFGTGVALGERPGEGYIRIYGYSTWTGKYEPEWVSPDMNGDVQGLEIIDVDGDMHPEIVCAAGYRYREGYVYIIKHMPGGTGGQGKPDAYKIDWQSDDVGPKPYGFDVGDVDGDDVVEILSGNQPGYLWIFDGVSRNVEWKSELLGTDVFGITHYDADKDGMVEIIVAQGGYIGKADWTSGYSTPHIYILDGRTRSKEASLGEPDYLETALQVAAVVMIIITLWVLNWYVKKRRKAKDKAAGGKEAYVDKVSRRRGVR